MTTARLALLLVLLAPVAPVAPVALASELVLREDAAPAVGAALGVERPLDDGTHLSAQIASDRIHVTAGPADAPLLHVTLVPADGAPSEAPRAAGSALLAEPGPAPQALVEAVLARLRAAERPVPWTPVPLWSIPSGDAATIAHLLDRGEPEPARRLLDALATGTPQERVRAAALRLRLGEEEAARGLLAGLEPVTAPNRALVASLRGEAPELGGCEFAQVALALAFVGRWEAAAEAARAIRERDAGCADAWAVGLLAALERGDPGVQALAAAAVAAVPGDVQVAQAAAGVWAATGQAAQAFRAVESLVRAGVLPPAELVGPLCRDPQTMAALVPELEATLAKDPGDAVARYTVGVALHYRNEFERSNALLLSLEEQWPEDQRLQIYVAMNDFNLGRTADALARLNRAAEAPIVDLDVFYCRAEVLRDTDPAAALADLERTAALAGSSPGHSEEKDARLRALIAATRDCAETGQTPCPGPWEHPRRRGAAMTALPDPPSAVLIVASGAAVVIVAGAAWALRRRREG